MIVFFAGWAASIAYAMTACMVSGGCPPVYFGFEQTEKNPKFKNTHIEMVLASMPWLVLGILGFIGLGLLKWPLFLALPLAGCNVVVGLKLRQWVQKEAKMPYPFIDFFLPRRFRREGIFKRWPMLLFDVLTIGSALFFFFGITLSSYLS